MSDSPYHAGEREVQLKSGVRERAEQLGRKFIRDFMPDQHREFFAELPWLLLGGLDDAAQPWASVLTGLPGFVHAPDPYTLEVRAQLPAADPLHVALAPGRPLGLLGIQPETRRRNRLNGRVVAASERGFTLHVDQSFGNCPKYITQRSPKLAADRSAAAPQVEGPVLSAPAIARIEASDTCFIASASRAASSAYDTREGADVSHRGGPRGFVRVEQHANRTELYMPDYAGNNAFNTLGNIASYPRAGLLFPEFDSGDVLMVGCDAEILWDPQLIARFPGAQRVVRFAARSGWTFPGRLPFQWQSVHGP
ncbi:MAG TPA: pyridoxamine 5'-phosphate oxidase family protein [Polyangiales bacterium]|nr:pyridoxamine 5'-phosphate oxidase family protein [Polyangiales bacterium]